LQKEETRRDLARAKMDQTNKLLVQVKSDIEHLANKVQFLKAVIHYELLIALNKLFSKIILS
jgi:hypothetical protein